MKTTLMSTAAAALLLGSGAAQATPIDLAALGLVETTPVYEGAGGVFYDDFETTLSDDFGVNPLVLNDFAGSEVILNFDGVGTGFDDFADVVYAPFGDFEDFDIVASGDNGSDTVEFLLTLIDSDLTGGTTGLGDNAILRITSGDFDFATFAPLDFLADISAQDGEFATDVEFTLTSLTSATIPVIPLPATLPLILAGMGSLAWLRRRG